MKTLDRFVRPTGVLAMTIRTLLQPQPGNPIAPIPNRLVA